MIDCEADPQHVAADIGDAVAGLERLVPALRIRASEGEEPRVRLAIERVEKLGTD